MAAGSSSKLRPSSVVLSVGVFTISCVTQIYIVTERLSVLLRKIMFVVNKRAPIKVRSKCMFHVLSDIKRLYSV